MHYLRVYDVVPEHLARRAAYLGEHLALADAAVARGDLVLGSAPADPADGAVLLFRGPGPETAERFAQSDSYVRHGLVTA